MIRRFLEELSPTIILSIVYRGVERRESNKRNHWPGKRTHQRQLAKKRIEDGVEFHPKLFRRSKPGEDLDYCIYKNIPIDEDPEKQIRSILQIAPILPGQQFTDKFFIPAFEKIKSQKKMIENEKQNPAKQ